MDVLSAAVTLFLVMDPLGNIPLFLTVRKTVPPARRRMVLLRELVIAYVVLILFLSIGNAMLVFLGLEQEAGSIAGGILLFLIALRMINTTPGSVALDVSPDRKILYVHVMYMTTPEAARDEVKRGFERRVLVRQEHDADVIVPVSHDATRST